MQAMADLISKTYQIDEGRAKVLTMSVFGIVNWTFTWLKPGGSLTYPQYAEAVVGILEGGLNGGAERMQHIPIRKSKPPQESKMSEPLVTVEKLDNPRELR